jgi:enolase
MDRRDHAKGWVVGGYGLTLKRNVDFMDLIVKSNEGAGYRPSKDVVIALNPASSGFYEDGLYKPAHRGTQSKYR